MVIYTDFLGTLDTNLYYFGHFDINYLTLFYSSKLILSEG